MADLTERIDQSDLHDIDLEGWTTEEVEEYLDTGKGPLADVVKGLKKPKEGEK